MKLRKKLAAMGAAMVMAIGAFGIEANAAGYIYICSNTNNKVQYEFDNINSTGYTSTDKFNTYTYGNHTVSFTPTTGSSTTIKIVRKNNSVAQTIVIPQKVLGMPSSLSSTCFLELDTTYYRIKATSSGSTNGYITIYDAYEYTIAK